MRNPHIRTLAALGAIVAFAACGGTPEPNLTPGAAGLASDIAASTGLSEAEAAMGAGAVFGVAQQNLSPSERDELARMLPGSSGLTDAAGDAFEDGMVEMTEAGQAAQAAGGMQLPGVGRVGNAGQLVSAFDQLGLDPALAGQVVPPVLDYATRLGGPRAAGLLRQGLGIM